METIREKIVLLRDQQRLTTPPDFNEGYVTAMNKVFKTKEKSFHPDELHRMINWYTILIRAIDHLDRLAKLGPNPA